MFKYEDMDYQSLSTSLDIENPDGPDELYALAQFCRMGKGIQPSEENYRLYLKRAADAGSQKAIQELNTLSVAVSASKTQPAEKAVASMTLPEMLQAADNGNPYVLLPLAEKALTKELLDLPKAKAWLEKAAALAPQGVYSDADATKIYLMLARLLTNMSFDTPENRELSHRYFGLAAELGSQEACDALADQYESGYGCKPDADKVKFYRSRGVLNNDPAYLCRQCCKLLVDGGSRMDLAVNLARIPGMTQDPDLLDCTALLTAALGQAALTPGLAAWGWAHCVEKDAELFSDKNKNSVLVSPKIMALAYGDDPQAAITKGLPVDAEKAGELAFGLMGKPACFTLAKYGAEHGNVQAQAVLAECYRTGCGTTVDAQQCIAWAEKAAAAKNSFAMVVLGNLYRWNSSVHDDEKARDWLIQAKKYLDSHAYWSLGQLYEDHDSKLHSYEEYEKCYKAGSTCEDDYGLLCLGKCYEHRIGVEHNYEKAVALYEKVAAKGNADALLILGECYDAYGYASPTDYAKSVDYYQRASDMGNAEATSYLAIIYDGGAEDVPADYPRSLALFKRAEALGYCMYNNFANIYMHGRGTAKNYDLAYQYIMDGYEKYGASAKDTIESLQNLADTIKSDKRDSDATQILTPIYAKMKEIDPKTVRELNKENKKAQKEKRSPKQTYGEVAGIFLWLFILGFITIVNTANTNAAMANLSVALIIGSDVALFIIMAVAFFKEAISPFELVGTAIVAPILFVCDAIEHFKKN